MVDQQMRCYPRMMRPVLLVLLIATFICCVDVDIKKLSSILSGMSDEESSKFDEIMKQSSSRQLKGKKGQAEYESVLKEKNLYEKVIKFNETMKTMAKENRRALGFVAAALQYSSLTRHGSIKEAEASTMIKKAWSNLRKGSKAYLLKKYPELKEMPKLTSE